MKTLRISILSGALVFATFCKADSMRDAAIYLIKRDAAHSVTNIKSVPPSHAIKASEDSSPVFQRDSDPVSPKKVSSTNETAPEMAADVVRLPQVDVTASRIRSLQFELEKQDEAMKQEAKHAAPSELDSVLNSDQVSLPKWLGGESASTRAAESQNRLDIMELERKLIIAIDQAPSEEDKRSLRKMLFDLKSMQRSESGNSLTRR